MSASGTDQRSGKIRNPASTSSGPPAATASCSISQQSSTWAMPEQRCGLAEVCCCQDNCECHCWHLAMQYTVFLHVAACLAKKMLCSASAVTGFLLPFCWLLPHLCAKRTSRNLKEYQCNQRQQCQRFLPANVQHRGKVVSKTVCTATDMQLLGDSQALTLMRRCPAEVLQAIVRASMTVAVPCLLLVLSLGAVAGSAFCSETAEPVCQQAPSSPAQHMPPS
jgi:hypothetical protein